MGVVLEGGITLSCGGSVGVANDRSFIFGCVGSKFWGGVH